MIITPNAMLNDRPPSRTASPASVGWTPFPRKGAMMMGRKYKNVHPLPRVSLEDLVPSDRFYRPPEAKLDLPFVRDRYSHR